MISKLSQVNKRKRPLEDLAVEEDGEELNAKGNSRRRQTGSKL